MSLHSVSSFQEEWYTNKKYKLWISKSSKSTGARCTLCKKDIDISTMVSSALDSHAKGKKHLDRRGTLHRIRYFFQKNKSKY